MTVDAAFKRIESENRKWSKINHLRFIGVPRTGTNPRIYRKTREIKGLINQRISVWCVFLLWHKIAYVMQKVYTLFIPE